MPNKTNTTLKQKLALIVLGFILTMVLLEIGLRLGGLIFMHYQEKLNEEGVTFTPGEYRILCIGESTTALGGKNAYPAQLEVILNGRQPGKNFQVINKGLVSKSSSDILAQLEDNLNKYRPELVIAMIGVNDKMIRAEGNNLTMRVDQFSEKFRVFQLFELLQRHLIKKFTGDKKEDTADTIEPTGAVMQDNDAERLKIFLDAYGQMDVLSRRFENYISRTKEGQSKTGVQSVLKKIRMNQYQLLIWVADYYFIRNDYDQVQQYLEKAISLLPDSEAAYIELGRCYMARKDYATAIALLSKAVQVNPKKVIALMELAQCYDALGQKDKVLEVYQNIVKNGNFKGLQINRDIGYWLTENNHFELAEKVLEAAVEENSKSYYLYERLGETYQKLGKESQAEASFKKAQELRRTMEDYLPVTVQNYNEIAEMVCSRNIPLIVMQYPRKDIAPLKKIFWSNYPIIFVENKTNFDQAIQKGQYGKYFSDAFAGVFGHCTVEGNKLIAEHLAQVVLEEVVNKTSDKNK